MLPSVLQQSSHEHNNISSGSHQDEILRSARANVGLIADDIWAPSRQDETYRKLNRALWIRSSEIAARYAELDSHQQQQQQQQRHETRSRVRDVIPDSRLASYGDFEYENEPSREVEEEDSRIRKDESPEITNGETKREDKESWMLDEVEEFVAWAEEASRRSRRRCRSLSKSNGRLKSSRKSGNRTSQEKSTGETSSYVDESTAPRFSVTNVSEAQLEGRIFSETVRSLWRTSSTALNSSQNTRALKQCQRELEMLRPHTTTTRRVSQVQLTHSSFQNERLRLTSNHCQYPYLHQSLNIVQHRVNSPVTVAVPPLCVDVPEFFPKAPNTWPCLEDQQQQQQAKSTQFYAIPTVASENSPYQDEIFPYKGHVAGRKTVAVYQNPVVPMVPTPLVSAVVWPPGWAQQRLLPAGPIHIHQLSPVPAPPPANCSMMPPTPQPQPTAPAAMCPTVVHRPIKIHESSISKPSPIPVYQRPQQQQSGKSSQEYSQRKKSQGVDFSNLILLTKSAMKVRRNQTKATKKAFNETGKGQSSVKAEGYSTRWLDKGCQPKREREFVTVSTIARLPITRSEDLACRSTNSGSGSRRTSQSADDELTEASRKRLYRDVLENSTTTALCQDDDEGEAHFEKRYDELERQAMEQYRTSEECLALRYQELEQQALEQYRNAESSESISLDQESLLQIRTTNNSNEDDPNANVETDAEQTPDYTSSSSGFGKFTRSSKKTANAAGVVVDNEKGDKQLQQRIKILRAENDGTSSSAKMIHRAASEGSLRPIAVAKRLSVITTSNSAGYGRESKNTIRGASGDMVVKPTSLSTLKRRLIPMSTADRKKAGTNLINNAGLDPMKAVQTLDKHVAAYYKSTKITPIGGGDDKVNNTGVWLSDFWS